MKTLKTIRKELGLNQIQIAFHLGITQSEYSRLERGERKETFDTINRYLHLLGYEIVKKEHRYK